MNIGFHSFDIKGIVRNQNLGSLHQNNMMGRYKRTQTDKSNYQPTNLQPISTKLVVNPQNTLGLFLLHFIYLIICILSAQYKYYLCR